MQLAISTSFFFCRADLFVFASACLWFHSADQRNVDVHRLTNFLLVSLLRVGRSDKLKPFWLSITEKEKLPQLDFLASALLSRETSQEYRRALAGALRLKCKSTSRRVVPFFGVFVRDLKATLCQNPSIIVVSSNDNAVPVLRVSFDQFVALFHSTLWTLIIGV